MQKPPLDLDLQELLQVLYRELVLMWLHFYHMILKKRAKPEEKKLWGKGSYEAIVSAEVANNANIGGSILPTLALEFQGMLQRQHCQQHLQ